MSDTDQTTPPAPKKKKGKLMLLVALPLLCAGLGGAGFYAMQSGMFSVAGSSAHTAETGGPRLVPKEQEKRAALGSGEGGGSPRGAPKGVGGDKYASTYYPFEKEFTSNLQDSVHFIQVGIAISTSYDDSVIEGIKTHEIAIRSAILLALGQTSEEEVFTVEGKGQMQKRLVDAINAVLKQKEGFGGVGNVYFTNFIVQ